MKLNAAILFAALSVSAAASDSASRGVRTLKSDKKSSKSSKSKKIKNDKKVKSNKKPPTDAPVPPATDAPVVLPATDAPVCTGSIYGEIPVYAFDSKFAKASSVSYSGQTARQLLIGVMKNAIGAVTAGDPGVAEAEFLEYYDCPGTSCDTVGTGVSVDGPLTVTQSTVGEVSDGKNLISKIAGKDITGQHKDWTTEFVGWNDWGTVTPQSPDMLVRRWAAVVDDLSQDVGNDPSGNPITKVFVSPQGQDYQQLTQKFIMGAIAFSQAADDYLDNDIAGKGLNAQNSEPAKAGAAYTSLEHAWDEGYGYFGAAADYHEYTDEEIAGKGGRDGWSKGSHDTNDDGEIDLKSEKNFGHSLNAAKRDLGSSSCGFDLTGAAYSGFKSGRDLIASVDGALSDDEMAELLTYRDLAIQSWEKGIAATVIHYINDMIADISEPELDFYGYAKHWSEAKGFALSHQFNRLSPVSDVEFALLHDLLRDAPELDAANFAAWEGELLLARDILETAFSFAPADVAGW